MQRLVFIILTTLSTVAFAEDFTKAEICKATIAVEMGRDPGSMKVGKPIGKDATVSYVRTDDGQTFNYKCRVTGDTVVWATYFEDSKSWGRWRNQYANGDAQTTFEAVGSKLVMSNDQSGEQVFDKTDF